MSTEPYLSEEQYKERQRQEQKEAKRAAILKTLREQGAAFREGASYALGHIFPYPIADTPDDWETVKTLPSHSLYCRGNDDMAKNIIQQKQELGELIDEADNV